jgi:hypothetical protein
MLSMSRILLVSGALAALAFAAGCGGSPSGPGSGGAITQEEATALAPEYEEYALLVFDDMGAPEFSRAPSGGPSRAASTVNLTFTRDRVCRLGGFVTVEGNIALTTDPDTRTGNRQFTATRIDNGCTFPARGGGTIKITGAPGISLTSNQAWTDGVLGTRTNTSTGSFTWDRGDGDTGTCQVSLTSTWAPATRTATISGTFCGFQVSATRTRS